MQKKLSIMLLCSLLIFVLATCGNNTNKEAVSQGEYSISKDNDIWEVGSVAKNLFDGGGTREETDEYVLYTYAERMIITEKSAKGEVIRYIGTKNTDDLTYRKVSVGDSLEVLLNAYMKEELVLQPLWVNNHLQDREYDKVYKYAAVNDSRQIIFSLKADKIVMIQIASNQITNNTTLHL